MVEGHDTVDNPYTRKDFFSKSTEKELRIQDSVPNPTVTHSN